jgi:hypothetical protein
MLSVLFFWIVRPGLTLCVGLAIAASCTSTYCFVGYTHYKHIAENERAAADRRERANMDLQDGLNRLRDQLAVAEARNDPTPDSQPENYISKQRKADRIAQFTEALDRLDQHLAEPQLTWASKLRPETSGFAAGHLQQSWALINLDQTRKRIEQLSAEYDETVRERDQLEARVNELEQKLSLSPSPQVWPGGTQGTLDSASETSPTKNVASPASARVIGLAPGAEQPPRVLKNFDPPDWAPDHFSNEGGPILGDPVPHPIRRAVGRKGEST